MLLGFFEHLRKYRVPVSIRELLDLLTIFNNRLVFADQDAFYFHARLSLVKDEKYYDRFDRAFASFFSGLDDWEGLFTEEDEALQSLLQTAGVAPDTELTRLLAAYRDAVEAQRAESGEGQGEGDGQGEGEGEGEGENGERGEGDDGEEGEGDDGEKGEGLSEEAEEGERAEETGELRRLASKVWLEREFADYDPDIELGTRSLKMALRRLRKWAREAADLELDLPATIHHTAANGGLLDIREVPERHNAVKVLMFLDVGGSMDDHIEQCAQLFSAASSEFKYLEYFYFHNCIYESVWTDNERRLEDRVPLWDLLHRYHRDYKVIFVGDADMGRQEITMRAGSVEHFNSEPGEVWLKHLLESFRSVVWLNPVPERRWNDSQSIQLIRRLVDNEMYFLSDNGLEAAMKSLMR